MSERSPQPKAKERARREHWLRLMLESRLGDLREESLHRQGRGLFHVAGRGHESLCALGAMLEAEDGLVPYYRDRGLVLGRGMTTRQLALEFFARRASASRGRMMPSHFSDRERGILSVATPTGVQLLPACGMAWAMKLAGGSQVVLATIGDAATRQGDFFEAVCFAREKRLPLWLIVEDNGYGISTPTRETNPLALGALAAEPWTVLDGWDIESLARAAERALPKLRRGEGPLLWWVRMERLCSHTSSDDQSGYRSSEELATLAERDPLLLLRDRMIAAGEITGRDYDALEAKIREEVRSTYAEAEQAEAPRAEELHAIGQAPPRKIRLPATPRPDRPSRMGDVFNQALREALAGDPRCVIFGEDVEDPKGGVFRLTKGLSTAFPGQVFNSPLAESTIVGVGGGLAIQGWRPIFEVQFIDFLWPGFHQLASNLANLRWRSDAQWSAPLILYAPYGGYLPGGSLWHSQANEAALAHFPGLNVVVPSTAGDAAGLLQAALASEDPTLILLPKHLLWAESRADEGPSPLGQARLISQGEDLTVVAWGNTIEVAQEALRQVGDARADQIDLRSIVPWDKERVAASVRKTGRLVVVQEDSENCSVGQMILADLMSREDVWSRMKAAPALVSKGNVMIGFSPVYEYAALPDAERVAEAIRRLGLGTVPMALASSPMEVVAPNFGEGLRSARLVRWLKNVGDSVQVDETLCEIETDKAIFPIEAARAGIVTACLVREGDIVALGQVVATIGEAPSARSPRQDSLAISPAILRRLAPVVPASLQLDCRWAAIRRARDEAKRRLGEDAPTPSAMVAWCLVRAQESHAAFRRLIDEEGKLETLDDFDFGLAVALENDGLGAAVIPRANRLSWPQFTLAYRAAVRQARAGEMTRVRAPVNLTSLGAFGVETATPIVVPPAVATVFLGAAHPRLSAVDGNGREEAITLAMTFDHRAANGVGAAAFLKTAKDRIEGFAWPRG